MRRIASAAIAYLHACGCANGRRDPAGEHAVLMELVGAMVRRPQPQPQPEEDDDAR